MSVLRESGVGSSINELYRRDGSRRQIHSFQDRYGLQLDALFSSCVRNDFQFAKCLSLQTISTNFLVYLSIGLLTRLFHSVKNSTISFFQKSYTKIGFLSYQKGYKLIFLKKKKKD